MRMQTGKFETFARGKATADVAHGVGRYSEFVDLQTGRNMRVAASIDIGIDPKGNAHPCATFAGETIDSIQLPFGFRVDRLHSKIDRLREFRRSLAHAGEDNLLGNETGAQRHVDLAT